ncbi:MAG: phenylalanine--tRNA ligase subunit beta [Gammaproteobacteria bacterium]|nr:MAG: phenylalanine--tRNA ligase subunit beta [Gammaproteobacteria bacterium]
MRLSDHWLREWVNPALEPEQLGHELTMAGLELDSLEPAAPPFSGVVVAEVLSVEPHPDADKLRVCQVNDGSEEPVQVVCGAPNVRAGMKAPFARVGAVLPGGLKIRKAKLRGVPSFGMLCSAKELGLSEAAEGLMELPADAPTGEDLRTWLDLDDVVYEIDLTPNRADCLSVAGIARETALLTSAPLTPPEIDEVPAVESHVFPVEIEDAQACPRYVGRVITGIDAGAETPLWMQERLRRSGIRSIHPVVDITNYVMIELGQPMHAFDLDQLDGAIHVRQGRAGERLTLLDGQEVALQEGTLVIADDERPLALAGIMGGADSGVSGKTRDIFLESAFFRPEAIAGRARQYGLHTDSSHRFERGVDPELQAWAIERATRLILAICGGSPGPVTDEQAGEMGARPVIELRKHSIPRILGVEIDEATVQGILERLGCQVEQIEGGWRVVPPSWRFDLAIEVDLIEEVARVHGYHRIPGTSQSWRPRIRPIPEAELPLSRLRQLLVDEGLHEAITFSFVDREIERRLAPKREPIALANPISSDLAVMRTTLWSGLLPALRHNLNRQQSRVRLFETGLVFLPEPGDEILQLPRLAGVLSGAAWPEGWNHEPRDVDFFDLKGLVERLLGLGGLLDSIRFEPLTDDPALHPGQAARILKGKRAIGRLGTLHPELESALDLSQKALLFELDLAEVRCQMVPKFSEMSKFPAIRRDLAVVVDADVPAMALLDSIRELAIPQVRECHIFDVYSGEGVASGRKSIALGLILQDLSRTLSDEEVDSMMTQIVSRLEQEYKAALRN